VGGCSISVIDFWARNCLTAAPCEMRHCHGGNPIFGTKFRPLSSTASIFPDNKLLVDCLAFWNELRVDSTVDIKENVQNILYL
jgi:hypothetical protein